ncbi:hypothetical protein D3C72_1986920 [compost metagenome]
MHQAERLGARCRQRRACRHHLQRVLRIGQARHALGAAGAREDADLDFRQRDLDRLGVGGDAAVAGERKLEGAAHAGAVDRRHPRLARGFELAEQARHAADEVEKLLGGIGRILLLLFLLEGEHRLDHREVGAA